MEVRCGTRTYVAPHVWTANDTSGKDSVSSRNGTMQHVSRYIFFFCEPLLIGGCTPVVRSEHVARAIRTAHPDECTELDRRGIRYSHALVGRRPNLPIGRSWRRTYGTTRSEAEDILKDKKMEWEWLSNGDLHTWTPQKSVFRLDKRQGDLSNSVMCSSWLERCEKQCHNIGRVW